ncbi:MAG TPA: hypothetical protein DDW52_19955 [Planctomycetaceae bacterium]|nr:hypothetical protein [Planctomycetaceae bacterium]
MDDLNNKPIDADHGSGALGCSTPAVVGELRRLRDDPMLDAEQDATAAEVSALICQLLGEIILRDDAECDKLSDWKDEITSLRCKVIGACEWVFDQCGYWGHQYCMGCNVARYPDLVKLRCSEAKQQLGNITEDEYQSTLA